MPYAVFRYGLALCLVSTGLFASDATKPPTTYRAGVVEFNPPPPANSKKEIILKNARLYAQYAEEAAEMGVQLLVFPEYGLTTFYDIEHREDVVDLLQDVPDPKSQEWNPCEEPDKFNNTQILHELSCAASQNSLALVVNLLSREPCITNSSVPDRHCPDDGYYQFNTNLIFGKDGKLLARYHKRHLFAEKSRVDPAPQPEEVIVDLGFVRIGTVACFDLVFDRPLHDLVEKHGVRNIAYPTAWVNELPFVTAPQFFSAVAYGLGVNLLAANYYMPEYGSLGSGIFSSTLGVLNGTWDVSTPGRLVIADVPINPTNVTTEDESLSCNASHINKEDDLTPDDADAPVMMVNVPSTRHVNRTHLIRHQVLKNFVHANMSGMQGNITNLCQGSLCCNLTYKFVSRDNNDTYMFIARSGVRTTIMGDILGEQVCSVVRCDREDDIESCGNLPDQSHLPGTSFGRLTITGSFRAKYLYPSVFSTKLGLVNTHRWLLSTRNCIDSKTSVSFTVGKLNIITAIERSILEATIQARVYEWDGV